MMLLLNNNGDAVTSEPLLLGRTYQKPGGIVLPYFKSSAGEIEVPLPYDPSGGLQFDPTTYDTPSAPVTKPLILTNTQTPPAVATQTTDSVTTQTTNNIIPQVAQLPTSTPQSMIKPLLIAGAVVLGFLALGGKD